MAYLAPSLVVLRGEINTAHPGRDKSSDGWIGDAAHAARKSDHNADPPPNGVVRALDVDKDGMDKDEYRRVVLADPRTEYFIQDGLIYLRSNGFRPQKYTGSNGHYGHGHTSIRHGAQWENDTRPWGYKGAKGSGGSPVAPSGGKSIAEVADEVIAGKWGSGEERKRRLSGAGYSATAVQAEVNRKLGQGGSGATKSVSQLADEVLRGLWGSGDERKRRLGSQYAAVQAEVNRRAGVGSAPAPKPAGKSIAQLADEVQRGEWGNGPTRAARLHNAGYDSGAVQAEVNRRAGIPDGQAPQPTRLSLSAVATQVIQGQWSNGTERKRRLANAGFDADAVQAEVNRQLRRR